MVFILSVVILQFTLWGRYVTLSPDADDRFLDPITKWLLWLLCLPSVSLLIAVVRYDMAHPNEDAEGTPCTDDNEVAVLFDPDADEV